MTMKRVRLYIEKNNERYPTSNFIELTDQECEILHERGFIVRVSGKYNAIYHLTSKGRELIGAIEY